MDVAGSAVGGMHQDEPEPGVISVQGDSARHPVGIVVRVRDDHHQRQPTNHPHMIGYTWPEVEHPDESASVALRGCDHANAPVG